jgi:hypothetical protein
LILLDLIDSLAKKAKDTKNRIDVITDMYGRVSGLIPAIKLDTSLFLLHLLRCKEMDYCEYRKRCCRYWFQNSFLQ